MLAVGDRAPEFTAQSTQGATFSLSQLRGRPVILYFYPKARSLGCTREARDFASHYPELQARHVEVVGVSVDTLPEQSRFSEECRLPFPLISDADKRIALSYGVLGAFGYAKRVTFYLDEEGRVVDIVQGMLPGPHVTRGLHHGATSASAP
ncbi:MAG: peroxiredoxin [Thermoplasmata archaeon]